MKVSTTSDDALKVLSKALLNDPDVVCIAGWRKLVMVGVVQVSSSRMFGFCFDEHDDWEAAAPRQAGTLDALRRLHASMTDADPQRKSWVTCLLIIDADGRMHVDFEYDDPARWLVTPHNHAARIEQFRHLPS